KGYNSQAGSYVFLDPVNRSGVKDGSRPRSKRRQSSRKSDTRFIPQPARGLTAGYRTYPSVGRSPLNRGRSKQRPYANRPAGRKNQSRPKDARREAPPRRVRSVPGKADYVLPTSVAAWRSSSSCVVSARWAVSKLRDTVISFTSSPTGFTLDCSRVPGRTCGAG